MKRTENSEFTTSDINIMCLWNANSSLIAVAGEAPQGPGLLMVLDSGDENSTLVSITCVDVR